MCKEGLLIKDGILPTNAPLLSLQKNYYNEYKGIKSLKSKSMNNVRVGVYTIDFSMLLENEK